MGRILKQGGDYFVEFNGNGLRFQKKAGATEEEARAKLKAIEASLEETALDVDLSTVTVHQFVERFEAYANEVHAGISRDRYMKALTHFSGFLATRLSPEQHMKEITPRIIEDYKGALVSEREAAEVNLTLFLVRDILEHARTLRFLNDNPTQHLQFIPEGFASTPELLNEMPPLKDAERDVFEFILATGLKRAEAERLVWKDMDWSDKAVYIDGTQGHEVCTRRIPLDPALLSRWKEKEGRPDAKIFEGCDLSVIPFDVLQHTFAKNLLERGVKLFHLNRFLGLEDIADVYKYGIFLTQT